MSKAKSEVFRIPPNHYVHILDQNSNVTRLEVGPLNYICQDHEQVVYGPQEMVIIPPRHYVTVENPIKIGEDSKVLRDEHGQAQLKHGCSEVRLKQPPFPLYPGEQLKGGLSKLKMLLKNEAMRLRCLDDFKDDKEKEHYAGEEWLFEGPGLYVPNVNVKEVDILKARIIKENQALRLMAVRNDNFRDFSDPKGIQQTYRVAGEEWLMKRVGAYLPGAFEKVVGIEDAIALTDSHAIHMRAIYDFKDMFGEERKCGEEWLITNEMTKTYIPSVNERKIADVARTILSSRQFCVIENFYDDKLRANRLGAKRLIRGETSFFLHPKEKFVGGGIQKVYVLSTEEGLILRANQGFEDVVPNTDEDAKEEETKINRKPGETWMICGPMEYVPPKEASVIKKTHSLGLDSNEGVYVRNLKTGDVKSVIGETVMLNEDEELWEKPLPFAIEKLLVQSGTFDDEKSTSEAIAKRDKTKVITYQVPHNSAVQIYDYKEKKPRVVFGPALVMLQPDEMFTPLSLSGGKPKKGNQIRALHLLLGPDFSTDIITVETSDHARLNLRLSYNWRFDTSRFKTEEEATALFSVADFVGDMCNAMASRIRGHIAATSFDDFHKRNASIIKGAIFTKNRARFDFPANGLVITEIDIQEIEPIDARTRAALQKSVQLAIQITTDSQEATARHAAARMEQVAMGKLEQSKIGDKKGSEASRMKLLKNKADTRAVETTGQARAEAESIAVAEMTLAKASVAEAVLLTEANEVSANADLDILNKRRKAELHFMQLRNEIESTHSEAMAAIETGQFGGMIAAVGPQTIKSLALSRPQNDVAMLQGLGLQSTLVTNGRRPMNLFNTAHTMIGNEAETKTEDWDEDYSGDEE